MSYLDVNKFSFNGEEIRGFIINDIDEITLNITDIKVTFQKNRAIVFNIIIDNVDTIKYLNKTISINLIKGEYYHYKFMATVDNFNNRGLHSPFYTYDIVVDLIDFSKNDNFFINSNSKIHLQIIPTENMVDYMKRVKKEELLNFNDVTYQKYSSELKYLLELNSLIYGTSILIEKVLLKNNVLFQSQNINEHTIQRLGEIYPLLKNGHFVPSLEKHLNNYIDFKNSKNTIDLLLKTYFIDDVVIGKENYNLNDISGFIDLFDGIFFNLKIELENIKNSKTQRSKLDKEYDLKKKIEYILEKLEPNLKQFKYDIDQNEEVPEILSGFRNMIRHQKDFKEFDLHKIMDFSKGVLKLYIIKHILKINDTDYNIDRILTDFNIYPLIEHKYRYLNKEVTIYNTRPRESYLNKKLTDNTFSALQQCEDFKDVKPEDFIYDDTQTKKLQMIYIDNEDKIRRALLFFGIVIYNKNILQEEKAAYPLTLTYNELMENFGSVQDSGIG